MIGWHETFARLGIYWCHECDPSLDHEEGVLIQDEHPPTFHWRQRRMTKPGRYKALRRLAQHLEPELDELPTWRGLYLLNKRVLKLARQARIRLPRAVFDLDRARLRFLLGAYTIQDRQRMNPSEQRDFRAALRWAARS